MHTLPVYIAKHVHNIAESEEFKEYTIETNAGSNHGDNLVAIMTAITVSGTKNNGITEKLHLLCKETPTNETRRRHFNSELIFTREIYVYTKILPAFVRFQKEKGLSDIDSFLMFPKVYACEANQDDGIYLLIMEDLKWKNYKMWPKDKQIPLDHAKSIMRDLGKFHAISFAMKDQRPNEFEEFTRLPDTFTPIVLTGKMRKFNNKSIERAANVLKNPQHKQIMHDFLQTFEKTINEFLCGESRKEFGVIGHGDCWNNNCMFNYYDDQDTQLKDVCFLDWQLTHYCPPVLDLHYNIFSSTDKQFRDKHYDQLLQSYYFSLSETIRKLGSDPNELYTFENLQAQLKKYAEFALLCAPVIIQIRIASEKDFGDLDTYAELIDKGEEADLINKFDDATQKLFSTLINDLLTDLVDYYGLHNKPIVGTK